MMNMLRRLEEGPGSGDYTSPEAGSEEEDEEFLLKLEGLDIST